jgi:ketosteroid isomerase-like protein
VTAADELSERVRRAEDLLAIHQLLDDYGLHLDAWDYEAYSMLFTEDGEVDLGRHGSAKGRAAIREVVEQASGPKGSAVRIISNKRIELDGDRATTTAMFTVLVPGSDGGVKVASIGHHHDDLRRDDDGRWRFSKRRADIDMP